MLTNYYTLQHLIDEWSELLTGFQISDIYTQYRGELTLLFEKASEKQFTLKISLRDPLRFLYLSEGSGRARRNVADVFPDVTGCSLSSLSIADGDRLISMKLDDGRSLFVTIFGSDANVYVLDSGGKVEARFRERGVEVKSAGPEPRGTTALSRESIPIAETSATLRDQIRSLAPLLTRSLQEEVAYRMKLDAESSATADGELLLGAVESVVTDLCSPRPRIYWRGDRVMLLSLFPLSTPVIEKIGTDREEEFQTVDACVRIYARRKLAQSAFDRIYNPLERLLSGHAEKVQRSMEKMHAEFNRPSRADRYECWGHLLMANLSVPVPGQTRVELEDIMSGQGVAVIELDPSMSAVANAEVFYEKARRVRRAREEAVERLGYLETRQRTLTDLLKEFNSLTTTTSVRQFQKKNAGFLTRLSSQISQKGADSPFRHYFLKGGYEVFVGRNAAQNDRLTLNYARKFDLWLHARGVKGSHVVLRRHSRTGRPPAAIIEQAAAIAAYHSGARTQSFAPVIVTEKRYVRKPRKSLPGTVIVEREEVVMVEPGLPKNR